jgi:molybdopterin-containing oxidoreductase family molybdopterin binding subunit
VEKDPRGILALTFDIYSYPLLRAFATALGTPNVTSGSAGMFCGNASHPVSYTLTASNDMHPDIHHCNYLLMAGATLGFVGGHNSMGLSHEMADARARGMKLVVVDPVLTQAASHADEWLPIRPGTDSALALGIMHQWVLVLDQFDRAFLRRYTNATYLVGPDGRYVRDRESGKPLVGIAATGAVGRFDEVDPDAAALDGDFLVEGVQATPAFVPFRRHLEPYTPARVEEITTIPGVTIVRIAREMVEAAGIGQTIEIEGDTYPLRSAAVTFYRGISAHRHGMMSGQAMGQLNILLGAVDVPGGTINSSSSGPTWGPKLDPDGFITPGNPRGGHMKSALPRREIRAPETLELLELFPTAVYSRAMVGHSLLHGEEYGLNYTCEVFLQCRGNLMQSGPDPVIMTEALKTIPFICSMNTYPDETAQFADLLLPDTHSLERLVPIVSNPDGLMDPVLPGKPYSWNLQHPIVKAVPSARHWGEVLLDLADRLNVLPDMYTALNAMAVLDGPYALKRDQKYTWEEISDRWLRSQLGDDHGLDYMKAHGYYSGEQRPAKYTYPKVHNPGRVPLYLEHYIDAGQDVKAYMEMRGVEWDTSDYTPMVDWKPCLTAEESPPEFDLWVVNHKLSFLAGTYSGENPLLMDVADRNSRVFTIAINRATAERKRIRDGDTICLETPHGRTAEGVARLTEGVHPECLAVPAILGRKALGRAATRGKGVHVNSLLTYTTRRMDMLSAAIDSCIKVKVSRVR